MRRHLAGRACPGGLQPNRVSLPGAWVPNVLSSGTLHDYSPCWSFRLPKAAGLCASRPPFASFSQLVEQLQACVEWRDAELGALCMQEWESSVPPPALSPAFCFWQRTSLLKSAAYQHPHLPLLCSSICSAV